MGSGRCLCHRRICIYVHGLLAARCQAAAESNALLKRARKKPGAASPIAVLTAAVQREHLTQVAQCCSTSEVVHSEENAGSIKPGANASVKTVQHLPHQRIDRRSDDHEQPWPPPSASARRFLDWGCYEPHLDRIRSIDLIFKETTKAFYAIKPWRCPLICRALRGPFKRVQGHYVFMCF